MEMACAMIILPLLKTQKKQAKDIQKTQTTKKSYPKNKKTSVNTGTASTRTNNKRTSTRVKRPIRTITDYDSDEISDEDGEIAQLQDVNICFICQKVLKTTNLDEINAHIDNCLFSQIPDSNNATLLENDTTNITPNNNVGDNSLDFIEYEWAGQTRVRVTSLLEAPMSTIFNTTSQPTNNNLLSSNTNLTASTIPNSGDLDKALKKINSASKQKQKPTSSKCENKHNNSNSSQ
ncbi:hypothetical protein BB561_007003, partial [Smittium simulii]